MRVTALFLFLAAGALAQPPCTQITQQLYVAGSARPVLMNGSITLTLGYTAQNGAFTVVQSQAPIAIVAGKLSVCLLAGSYTADYSVNPVPPLNQTIQYRRYWTVPPTGGPYKLSDIPAGAVGPIEGQLLAPPSPTTYAVGATGPQGPQGPSGLPTPPSTGSYVACAVNGVVSWMLTCALSWTHLANSQWAGMTNSQWTGMEN